LTVPLKLILANKAYSSWSLRPWLLLAQLKIPFEEVVIPMDQPETRASMLKYAPTGKCPSLHDPEKTVWPKGKAARAHARSLTNEMHAGFGALRQTCPTNFRRPVRAINLHDEVRADVARIEAAWEQARATFGRGGPYLFGRFSAADAMFAPVVNRFHVYDIPVSKPTRAYTETIMSLPVWKAWIADAHAEPWRIERYDAI
jgi:glutathione S-transferase